MKKVVVLILVFVSIYAVSNAQQKRIISKFSDLEVTDKINVKIIPSDQDYIEVDGSLQDKFELIQQGNVLRLKMAAGYLMQGSDVNITLYYTSLGKILARKGAKVFTDKKEITQDSLYLSANEGSKIDLQIHVNQIKTFTTTGGQIDLRGIAKSQIANIALGGFYYAKDLLSDVAQVSTNAGGKSEVNVGVYADLQTRAGGVIDVYGNPKDKKVRRLAGGKINFKD